MDKLQDERLLTDDEIDTAWADDCLHTNLERDIFRHSVIVAKAQDTKTASILQAECQAKIDAKDKALHSALFYIGAVTHGENIEPTNQIKQALKQQEGVK